MTDKMREQCDRLRELIAQYWDIAWREGSDGRRHDTEEGSAQECINEIEGVIHQIEAAQRQGGEAVGWLEVEHWRGMPNYQNVDYEHGDVTLPPGRHPLYTAQQPAVPAMDAISKATTDYARGRDVHEIFKELKDVERYCS